MTDPVSLAVITGLAGAAGTTIIGGLTGGEDKPPPAPTPAKPTVMPTPDSASMEATRKKSLVDQAKRQGRASTILTSEQDTSDKLGG